MRLIKIITFILCAVVVLCGSTTKAGVLQNGGFESGLTDWTATGTVQAVEWEYPRDFLGLVQAPASGLWEEVEGDYFASLWSTDGFGTDTSTLSQTFDAPAGYRVEFDYFYDFGDEAPYYDPARIYVADSFFDVFFEIEINYPGDRLGDDVNIDWTSVSVVLPNAGPYTLGFEIEEELPFGYESYLGVDNVSVVPLPSALVLGSLGLGVAGSLVGKFQRRRTRQ